eukprot:TRINITY_DN41519_c0_g1_i1.p1 TRINITY_DN41519_c0_g1~~TRINITY_DN41519_c0_g1_i1.p1  ORF type:complete len:572 (-),score=119.70 TRINITY_DN41519_c0_g1_i1:227-1912(-)
MAPTLQRRQTVAVLPAVSSSNEEDALRSVLRSDVLKLHELAAGAKQGGQVAARRASAGPIEEQLRAACTGRVLKDGEKRSVESTAAAACGALWELVLSKLMEAALCGLEDTDDGTDGVVAVRETLSSAGRPVSFIGPFLAAMGRLRRLHERARASSAVARYDKHLTKASVAPQPALQKSTRCAGVQTDEVGKPAATPACQTAAPPAVKRKTTATQTVSEEPGGATGGGSSASKAVPAERRTETAAVQAGAVCSTVATQTVEKARKQLVSTASQGKVSTSHMGVQTEKSTPGSCQKVRLLRMHRIQKQQEDLEHEDDQRRDSQPLAATALTSGKTPPIVSAAGCDRSSNDGRVTPKATTAIAAASGVADAVANISAPRQRALDRPLSSSSRRLVEQPSSAQKAPREAFRCPGGHGLQYCRVRDATAGPGGSVSYRCSQCGGVASAWDGFHSCAVCYKDSGQRYLICHPCSAKEVRRAGSGGYGDKQALQKSMSAGSLSRGPRGGGAQVASPVLPSKARLASSSSEWMLVSSGLPQPEGLAAAKDTAVAAALSLAASRADKSL